jgi:hypothetical protein
VSASPSARRQSRRQASAMVAASASPASPTMISHPSPALARQAVAGQTAATMKSTANWRRHYKERAMCNGKPRWYALTSGDMRSVDSQSARGQGWVEWHGKIRCTLAWKDMDAAVAAGWS